MPYPGHRIAVIWDVDGRRFGARGLSIEVDRRVVARRPLLTRVTVPLARAALPPIARPINQAVQLVRGQFLKPSASGDADAEALHDAIDGRILFYPEIVNGWSPPPSPQRQWFAVEFGARRRIARAELAFFADGRFAAPIAYRYQAMTPAGGTTCQRRPNWRSLTGSHTPVGRRSPPTGPA